MMICRVLIVNCRFASFTFFQKVFSKLSGQKKKMTVAMSKNISEKKK